MHLSAMAIPVLLVLCVVHPQPGRGQTVSVAAATGPSFLPGSGTVGDWHGLVGLGIQREALGARLEAMYAGVPGADLVALVAQGVADSALEGTIDAEIRSGKLPITKAPTAGYRIYGPVTGYDPARNAVSDRIDAWQSIHMPYRTAASMGLSTTEDGIHPYVMASGTYWAHVMIMQLPLRY
jgi:hypothetical protein